ncbi:MAG: alpha-galactosidase [Thermoguttaceae bacterium]|nr:alpha-galactosidase [Thermoguttaceae bacterium]MDW8037229.1 alpha-galactosidase [Thermoguttaceae bacterium]
MKIFWRFVWVFGIGALGAAGVRVAAAAEESFQPVPADWKPTDMRPIAAVRVTASSVFMGAGGPYAPELAIDGNRRTKWVAEHQPSPQSPQWIVLEFLAAQEVVGLALFGERPDNDGLLDAQVQAAGPGQNQFTTVAEVKDAKTPSWLVRFAPVKTNKVRLLITRSGGPSTHTDIYEIIPLGRPLSPEELKTQAAAILAAVEKQMKSLEEAVGKFSGAEAAGFPPVVRRAAALTEQGKTLAARFAQWDALDPDARMELVEGAQRLAGHLERLNSNLQQAAAIWSERLPEIQSMRRQAQQAGAAEKAAAARTEKGVRLFNQHVLVHLNETDNQWDAVWLGPVEAAVRGVRMAVELNGQTLPLQAVQAEIAPVTDKLGAGASVRQRWDQGGLVVEREIKVYDGKPAVVITGRIINRTDREATLGSVRLLDIPEGGPGWWYAGDPIQAPGAVYVQGISDLSSQPIVKSLQPEGQRRDFTGTGVLAMGHEGPAGALVLGYLTALEACPDVHALFEAPRAGVVLRAAQRFLGRKLPAGATLELDTVYVSAHRDIYEALEHYGDAAAAASRLPVRKGPTSLWCSWYAHRMAMTEELVLANAAVAAKHFKPLGMEIIQLDHGWQRGDITGDWVPKEQFPHGLAWLADELKKRYGFRLGVWISPTDVAETSQTFHDHPDWMLKDERGQPRINWRWYWKPNPNCYELDASHPEAARFIRDTFARLSKEGVSYYKIDFIAACAGEHFVQHDPTVTRGWGVLRRAMEAVREGAGPEAWIRYCQTPPLLSVGLADSAYGAPDTLDAGRPDRVEALRTNARILAASYWLNDRLYHREVCDMSVRMQGAVEEVRLAVAMMTLAGCSISFSDELQYLPPSRIRLMQQALPAGAPPMRPLDLLERNIPSVWHLHCKTEADQWDVVGLFNFEDRPEERTVELARLGLKPDQPVVGFEFWEEKFLGVLRDRLTVVLPPQSSRIVFLRPLAGRPQLVGTNMHLLGGWHELKQLRWDDQKRVLSGRYHRAPGLEGRAFFYVPPEYQPHFEFPLNPRSARLTNVGGGLWMQEVQFQEADFDWSIPFDGPEAKTESSPKVEPNQTQ